jgi:hypothetical protein
MSGSSGSSGSDLRVDLELLTLDDAKRHLRLNPLAATPDEDDDLRMKVFHATALVLDYLARPTDATWTAEMASWTTETVPRVVQAAVLVQLAELYRFRGDDAGTTPTPEHGFLSPLVTALLHRYRDPTLA